MHLLPGRQLAALLARVSYVGVSSLLTNKWTGITYRPLLDGSTSHAEPDATQLEQGLVSMTSQRTRRVLQVRHACFARGFLDGSSDGVGDVILY